MNRANQLALFQATNQGLLNIRQSELNYYINLNIAFGTQAALIGGFTYGVFTQNQYNQDYEYSYIFQYIYWITSAGTIATSVHVIITTMLLQVLGPGLALHGPIGSVASAAEGMRTEQKTVIVAFIFMMVLFSLSTVLSFWAVMSQESAIGSTVVFIIAGRYWYYYSERIYLRFFWDPKAEAAWESQNPQERQRSESFDPASLPVQNTRASKNPLHDRHMNRKERESNDGQLRRVNTNQSVLSTKDVPAYMNNASNTDITSNDDQATNNSRTGKRMSRFLPKFFSGKSSTKRDSRTSLSVDNTNDTSFMQKTSPFDKTIAMEGYLSKKDNKTWLRYYVILEVNGRMFFYSSRQDFRRDPRQVVYKRPLIVTDHAITVYNSEEQGGETSIADGTESVASSSVGPMGPGGKKVKFEITFTPFDNEGETVRYPWIFRCDTEEELDIWVQFLRELSPQSFEA